MHWLGEQEDIVYQIAAFVICFIVVSIALWMLAKLLTNFANLLSLGVLNRLLGGAFSLLKYALLLSLVLFGLNALGKEVNIETKDSHLYAPIASLAPSLLPLVSEYIEQGTQEESVAPDL